MSTLRFDHISLLANQGDKALLKAINEREVSVQELVDFAVTLAQLLRDNGPCSPEGVPISDITGYGR